MNRKVKGSLAVLGTAIAYGSYGVWAKLIGSDFQLFFQTYTRAVVAWMIVVAIVIYSKDWKKIQSKYDLKVLLAIAGLGILTQSIYYSYLHLGIGLASIIYFFAILFIQFFIGYFFYGEKISFIKLLSLILSIFGVYLIFKNDINSFQYFPMLVAIISGFAVGAQASITKLISNRYSSWQISVFSWFGVIITCIPLSLYFQETQHLPELNLTWVYLVLFAILGLSIFPLLIYGYKRIDVSLGGLIGLIEIPIAVAFGYLFFNEQVTPTILIGATIILISASLPDLKDLFVKQK